MNPLRICISCPASPGSRTGNRITALRWQAIFRGLGHRPTIRTPQDAPSRDCDLLVALHARKSADAIRRSKNSKNEIPVVLALTGTDLYSKKNRGLTDRSIKTADRIVVLQSLASRAVPRRYVRKLRTIHQSIKPLNVTRPSTPNQLRVLVAGHLRDVKDPMRAEQAARRLPPDSKIVVEHFGSILEPKYAKLVKHATKQNARYRHYGEISRWELRRRLAKCWMMVLSSKLEGGANVLSEAIVQHTPVLVSRIDGSVGLLGESYEGYYEVGNTKQLRHLLNRCEREPKFYAKLVSQVKKQSKLFLPKQERQAWRKLLAEL